MNENVIVPQIKPRLSVHLPKRLLVLVSETVGLFVSGLTASIDYLL